MSSVKPFGKGDTGPRVSAWQRFLYELDFVDMMNCPIVVDGDFGPNTEFVTRSFQAKHELAQTGFVDLETMACAMDMGFDAPKSDGVQVPPTQTIITLPVYVAAMREALPRVWGDANENAIAMFWAQYKIETGGVACWNWNVGNAKKFPGDGFDFHCLNGVWEGVSPEEAERLFASGEAHRDPSENHATAVGAARVSVVFEPPHPATRFRAFHSLEEGLFEHLKLSLTRFPDAYPHALLGNVFGFASALRARGYFTASAESYAAGMMPAYEQAKKHFATEALA